MQKHFCDKPECGRAIEGNQLARQPAQVKIEGVGLVTVSFTFAGKIPDLCNCCLLDAAASLDPRNRVVQLSTNVVGSKR